MTSVHYLSENEYLAENETSCIIKQILEATSYLHSMKIAHLDLKPENIMVLDKNVRPVIVKLIDFGLSHVIVPGQPCKAMNGTPEFVCKYFSKKQTVTVQRLKMKILKIFST